MLLRPPVVLHKVHFHTTQTMMLLPKVHSCRMFWHRVSYVFVCNAQALAQKAVLSVKAALKRYLERQPMGAQCSNAI